MGIWQDGYALPALSFDEYRQCYYWFQLQFFLRSRSAIEHERLLRFLFDLFSDSTDVHYRWELKERGKAPERVVKRLPRGMRKVDRQKQLDAMPEKAYSGAYVGEIAHHKSIRCRYMLFDWLRTRNNRVWANFSSLYRALIVFDLYHSGHSFNAIARNWGGDDFMYLADMKDNRLRSNYEIALKDIGICNSVGINTSLDPPLFFRAITQDEFDEKKAERLSQIKIKKYYLHAEKLIHLACTGKFQALSKISPIKY